MTDAPRKLLTREEILASPKADLNDPAEKAIRAQWTEEERQVKNRAAEYQALSRQLADGEPVDYANSPIMAGVVYEITSGARGERVPENSEAVTVVFLLATIARPEYSRRLAERYLEETGAPLELARQTRTFRLSTLKANRADEFLQDLAVYCNALAATEPSNRHTVPAPPTLSDDDVTEARELVARSLVPKQEAKAETLYASPLPQSRYLEHSAAKAALETLRGVETPIELPAVKSKFPAPAEWLAKQGREYDLRSLEFGLERLATEAAERELEEERRGREEDRKRWQNNQLPVYARYPVMALDNFTGGPRWQAEQLTFLEEKRAAGLLDVTPNAEQLEGWRSKPVTDINPVHWNLSVPEWRILHAVFSLYTASGVVGDGYGAEYVPEDWPRLYQLAGIPERTDKHGHRERSGARRTELKEAIGHLASRRVRVFVSLKKPNGRWETAAPEVQLLERVPVWNELTDEENDALRKKSPERWPEPSGWLLRFPSALRSGLTNYFREVPTDLWERLEQAADGKHTDNVIRFVLKLYQLPPGDGATVRLSRETLADALPVLAGFAKRRQWSRFEQTVSDAAAIAHRACLLRGAGQWEKGRGPKGGRVFVCERNPAAFPMLNEAKQLALEVSVSGAKVSVSGAKVSVSGAKVSVSGARVSRKPKRGNKL